jgi:hypothetical protein
MARFANKHGRSPLRTTLVVLVVAVAIGSMAAAQQRGMMSSPMYDVATEVTLSGTIEQVTTIADRGGVHFSLKTATETVSVHLGPAWFLTQQKYILATGDAITVLGSRVKMDGGAAVLAREIKKGDQTMTFRDAKGLPKWSGRGRGGWPIGVTHDR